MAGSDLSDGLFDLRTEIGRGLAAVDWDATPLGPVAGWPVSLRNAVRLALGSRFAMWMGWGPELAFLCNDAYRRDTLGAKYPWALGRPAAEVWSEIWPDIAPRVESVVRDGESTWDEALFLVLERSGYQEETYHTFSYSPLTGDDGEIAGMLCVVSEDTTRVIGQRRLQIVRDLGTGLAAATTVAQVNAVAAHQLGHHGSTIPFALAYVVDDPDRPPRLAWTAGVPAGHPMAPAELADDGMTDGDVWPAHREVLGGRAVLDDRIGERFADLPTGSWDAPPHEALLLPLLEPGHDTAVGFLVVGITRLRALDEEYRGFLELLAGQLAAALIRARAFEEERRRAEELAALDRAKTTFFTNVSHELRTPLTLLLGPASDALADTDAPLPDAQRARVEVVERNAERLLKLVNTLLDFSRLESGRVTAHYEPLDLARYTTELAAMFESAMSRAGLGFEVQCDELPERTWVDREMWSKIVLNLVSNALKATFAGSIRVGLRADGEAALLTVTDTGIGIPPAEQGRLFERFHRVVGADLRSHEGSGIGLALVAELVALHGGTVSVDSVPGRGSTFSVRVPYGVGHLPAAQVADTPRSEDFEVAPFAAGFLSEAERWLVDAPSGAVPVGASTGPRVLVVDDNADMRQYVSGLLADEYAVVTAVDGQDGLDTLRASEQPIDLVLTDVMMPRLTGFELLAELRRDPDTMHIPVVMLSARSGDESASEGLEAGADDYLVKPFSARELLARVRSNLELDRARRLADQLHRSRSLLDQAEGLARVGSWELDLGSGRLVASEEFLRMLDLTAADLETGVGLDAASRLAPALQALHPDDRDAVRAAFRTGIDTGMPVDVEARLARHDRLVRARAVLLGEPGGAPVLRGSLQDVTDQRRAEEAIAASAAAREAAAREHAIAEELQRSLLPSHTPNPTGLKVGVYYAAGVEGTQAGGDWYDVIELDGGRSALVIGDVMGRGVRAAAVMGQVRATVRAYARLDIEPGRLTTLLDAAVHDLDDRIIVTCVYGIHDPADGSFTYANAGHLPPLLALPGEVAHRLPAGDPPLGSGACVGTTRRVSLPPGARLLLYTDGLVEQRDSELDGGIDAAAAALGASRSPVEGIPGGLVDRLLAAEPDDDVAVLVAEAVPAGPDDLDDLVEDVTPDARSVPLIRAVVRERLAAWHIDERAADDVELVVSELVGNAVRHAAPPVRLQMRRDRDRVVLDVSDGAEARPQPRALDPESPDGRGLFLIETLAEAWGVRPTGAGKSVWCTVAAPHTSG